MIRMGFAVGTNGRVALGFLNRGPKTEEVRLKWTDIALKSSSSSRCG